MSPAVTTSVPGTIGLDMVKYVIVWEGVSGGEYVAPCVSATVSLLRIADSCEKSTSPLDVTATTLFASGSAERNSGVMTISGVYISRGYMSPRTDVHT